MVAWTPLPRRTIPAALDVAWCRFPDTPKLKPAKKLRPCLVRAVKLSPDGKLAAVEVSYGTRWDKPYRRLAVTAAEDMRAAGLRLPTYFQLDTTKWLPWVAEFFERRADGTGPVIGRLSDRSQADLRKA